MLLTLSSSDSSLGGAAKPLLGRTLPRPIVGPLHCSLEAPQALPAGAPSHPGLQTQPLGMHVAMYNMLLLQDPALRAQLPPLPSYLAGDPLSLLP